MTVRVVRHTSAHGSGDCLTVDGVALDLRDMCRREHERAKRLHPDNPAFNMRPMFWTGSPYADEILALLDDAT